MCDDTDGRQFSMWDEERTAPERDRPPGPSCVLVVDDDASGRTTMRRMVEGLGYRCEEASGGLGALACLGAHAIDIVLTDHTMPDLNGLELLRSLENRRRAGGYPIPGILVTGSSAVELDAESAGALAVLRKPIGLAQLRVALATADAAIASARVARIRSASTAD